MKHRFLTVAAIAASFATMNVSPSLAATFSGMITVTRDTSRSIVSASLETQNRDGAGNLIVYNIVMDENGRAIADQYENKDIKIDGALNGKDITADTWEGIREAASQSYSEPEPSEEPADEPAEEPSEKEEPDDETDSSNNQSADNDNPDESNYDEDKNSDETPADEDSSSDSENEDDSSSNSEEEPAED